jgi:hypothetical protein
VQSNARTALVPRSMPPINSPALSFFILADDLSLLFISIVAWRQAEKQTRIGKQAGSR